VSWIVSDVGSAVAKTGSGRWTGPVTDGDLPARARDELVKRGVTLAPAEHVLAAILAPPDPLHLPALIVMGLAGAIAVGLLLGGMIQRIKVGRIDAILR
jgi:hypothetical protein